MEVRTVYGLGESADGQGNGLRAIVDAIRAKYPTVDTPIHACFDNVADDVSKKLLEGKMAGANIWLGHSYGIAAMKRAMNALKYDLGLPLLVHHLILVDGVTRLLWGQFKCNNWVFPVDVVLSAHAFYQKNQREPDSSILLDAEGKTLINEDLTSRGVDHCTICACDRVRDYVLAEVDKWAEVERIAFVAPV